MSTDSSAAANTPEPPPDDTPQPDAEREPTLLERLGADWAAVIIAGALVVLAGLGLLPSIPFLIK